MKNAPVNQKINESAKTGTNSITLTGPANEPRVDSRLMAVHLGVQHGSIQRLLTKYADDFREIGIIRFQIGKLRGRGRPQKYALLNEDQAYLLLTYSDNMEQARHLRLKLIVAFREARQRADIRNTEYLPTYHAVHDEVARLAHGSTHERFIHINLNRAINNAVEIAPGQRRNLGLPHQAMLVVAQSMAFNAMTTAHDHHDGYRMAKAALQRLKMVLIGGAHV